MSVLERVGHGGDRAHGLFVGQLRTVEPLSHHQFGDQVGVVVVRLHADDGVDVGVCQLGGGAGLPLGARGQSLAAAEHLDRHGTLAAGVAARVHRPESALAEHLLELVASGHGATGHIGSGVKLSGLCHAAGALAEHGRESCKSLSVYRGRVTFVPPEDFFDEDWEEPSKTQETAATRPSGGAPPSGARGADSSAAIWAVASAPADRRQRGRGAARQARASRSSTAGWRCSAAASSWCS